MHDNSEVKETYPEALEGILNEFADRDIAVSLRFDTFNRQWVATCQRTPEHITNFQSTSDYPAVAAASLLAKVLEFQKLEKKSGK